MEEDRINVEKPKPKIIQFQYIVFSGGLDFYGLGEDGKIYAYSPEEEWISIKVHFANKENPGHYL